MKSMGVLSRRVVCAINAWRERSRLFTTVKRFLYSAGDPTGDHTRCRTPRRLPLTLRTEPRNPLTFWRMNRPVFIGERGVSPNLVESSSY